MASFSIQEIRKVTEDKIKLALVLLQKFINERNPREKQMIIIFGILGIIFFDYWLFINPVVKVFTKNLSQSGALESELRGLKDDQKNKQRIEQNWNQTEEKLEQSEKRFIPPNEMPAFLENISKLALDSGVKVMSLQPFEKPGKGNAKESSSPYSGMSIKISAIGGTHEFGKFLSLLETNPTFIKVIALRISHNTMDDRKHTLELSIEVYRKEASQR